MLNFIRCVHNNNLSDVDFGGDRRKSR